MSGPARLRVDRVSAAEYTRLLSSLLFYFLGSWVPSILQLTLKSIYFLQGNRVPLKGSLKDPSKGFYKGSAIRGLYSVGP